MNFKSAFWLFNIIFVLTVFMIVFLSMAISSYQSGLPRVIIVLIPVLASIAVVLDFYFIRNWKMFVYLEEQNWDSLLEWLEYNIYSRKRLNRPHASLLISTALSIPRMDIINRLREEVQKRKPDMMKRLGVALGVPILMAQDRQKIAEYFQPLADALGTHMSVWASWCWFYSQADGGIDGMMSLLDSRDFSVGLMAFDFLDTNRGKLSSEQMASLEEGQKKLRSRLENKSGPLRKSRENHVMAQVLSKRVDEAFLRLIHLGGAVKTV